MIVRIVAEIARVHPHRDPVVERDFDAQRLAAGIDVDIANAAHPHAVGTFDRHVCQLLRRLGDQIEALQTRAFVAIFDRVRIVIGPARLIVFPQIAIVAVLLVLIALLLILVLFPLLLILLLLLIILLLRVVLRRVLRKMEQPFIRALRALRLRTRRRPEAGA